VTTLGLGLLAETALERLGDHRSLVFEERGHGARELHERAVRLAGGRLGAHKHPREVHVVDAVPLTSVGKTDRKALRRRWTS
jgi:non-ribosomal peptide synthetase component E (peptide arylation enzyme)